MNKGMILLSGVVGWLVVWAVGAIIAIAGLETLGLSISFIGGMFVGIITTVKLLNQGDIL